jgi:hypothetical protein
MRQPAHLDSIKKRRHGGILSPGFMLLILIVLLIWV